MKQSLIIAASAFALSAAGFMSVTLAAPTAAQAGKAAVPATATFAIQNMICPLCPATVKRAMQSVPGVRSVSIDFERKSATVSFDPRRTRPAAIAAASTRAGYPARVAG